MIFLILRIFISIIWIFTYKDFRECLNDLKKLKRTKEENEAEYIMKSRDAIAFCFGTIFSFGMMIFNILLLFGFITLE